MPCKGCPDVWQQASHLGRGLTLLLCAFWLVSSARAQTGEKPLANGYSAAPLRAAPILSAAEIQTEARKFLAWLEVNGPLLKREQMAGPREHAYYLIGERIKSIYAESAAILPARHDSLLQALFMHADNLGVLAGSQIFAALKDPGTQAMPARTLPPRALSVALDGDLLRVRSELGWSFAVPYYFMIWQAADQQRPEGRLQTVTFSTGSARDATAAGHSQATLMFLFSREGAVAPLAQLLRSQVQSGSVDPPAALGFRDLRSQHGFNAQTKLHTEIVSWKDATGEYFVTYSGMDGAYQSNRPHFIDFLRSVQAAAPPATNN